jgi:hypothetical protein
MEAFENKLERMEEKLRRSFKAMKADIILAKKLSLSSSSAEIRKDIDALKERLGVRFKEIEAKIEEIATGKFIRKELSEIASRIDDIENGKFVKKQLKEFDSKIEKFSDRIDVVEKGKFLEPKIEEINTRLSGAEEKMDAIEKRKFITLSEAEDLYRRQYPKMRIKEEVEEGIENEIEEKFMKFNDGLNKMKKEVASYKKEVENEKDEIVKNFEIERESVLDSTRKDKEEILEETKKSIERFDKEINYFRIEFNKKLAEKDEKIDSLQRQVWSLKGRLKSSGVPSPEKKSFFGFGKEESYADNAREKKVVKEVIKEVIKDEAPEKLEEKAKTLPKENVTEAKSGGLFTRMINFLSDEGDGDNEEIKKIKQDHARSPNKSTSKKKKK